MSIVPVEHPQDVRLARFLDGHLEEAAAGLELVVDVLGSSRIHTSVVRGWHTELSELVELAESNELERGYVTGLRDCLTGTPPPDLGDAGKRADFPVRPPEERFEWDGGFYDLLAAGLRKLVRVAFEQEYVLALIRLHEAIGDSVRRGERFRRGWMTAQFDVFRRRGRSPMPEVSDELHVLLSIFGEVGRGVANFESPTIERTELVSRAVNAVKPPNSKGFRKACAEALEKAINGGLVKKEPGNCDLLARTYRGWGAFQISRRVS